MKDRIPTKPNRYAVYDDNHTFKGYEYHERADEATEDGNALNKANLLTDVNCIMLDIPLSSVPNDAITSLTTGYARGGVVVTAYETGTSTPIPNVLINGILSDAGGEVYTNNNGIAFGFTNTTSTTIQISNYYIN